MATKSAASRPQIRNDFDYDLSTMTRVHWLAMTALGITGVIHVYLFATQGFLPFLLAGLGFFGIIAGILVTRRGGMLRSAVYVLAIPFTLAQIGAWVAVGMPDFYLGVADKIVQIVLIAVLGYLVLSERHLRR